MTFDELIEALGERLGTEMEDTGGAAAVEVDGEVVILQDAGELLLLRAEVGEIPASGREDVLASAMEANFLYQGTGGATLAIDPSSGLLHIHKYNWMERLDPDAAFDMLERFAATAAVWRRIIADCKPARHAQDAAAAASFDAGGLLQV